MRSLPFRAPSAIGLMVALFPALIGSQPAAASGRAGLSIPSIGAVLAGTITWTLHGQSNTTLSSGGQTQTHIYHVDASTTYTFVAGAVLSMQASISLLNEDIVTCTAQCSANSDVKETLTGSYSGPVRTSAGSEVQNDSTGTENTDGSLDVTPSIPEGDYQGTGTYSDSASPSQNSTFQLQVVYPERDSYFPGGYPTYQALVAKSDNPTLDGSVTQDMADTIVVGIAVALQGQEQITWNLVVVYFNGVQIGSPSSKPPTMTPTPRPISTSTNTPTPTTTFRITPTPTAVPSKTPPICNPNQGVVSESSTVTADLRPMSRDSGTSQAPAAAGYGLDWAMPPRYAATMSLTSDDPEPFVQFAPRDWAVTVFATFGGKPFCAPGLRFTWTVDGNPEPEGCKIGISVKTLGHHAVTLTITGGNALVGMVCSPIDPEDRVIVGLGDSVASGEGVPTLNLGPLALWQNSECHRSHTSFEPLVAQYMEQRLEPHTSVTFLYLACSGASIEDDMIGSGGQIATMLDKLQGRVPSQVLLSIGANDLDFGQVIAHCAVSSPGGLLGSCIAQRDPSLQGQAQGFPPGGGTVDQVVAAKLIGLRTLYGDLDAALRRAGVAQSAVYVTEYFDPTRDAGGQFCTSLTQFGLVNGDIPWAYAAFVARLNATLWAAAQSYHWHYVGNIAAGFADHGYCAGTNRWIVTALDSFSTQGDLAGTLHPNQAGQTFIAAQVLHPQATKPSANLPCSTRFVLCVHSSVPWRYPMPAIASNTKEWQTEYHRTWQPAPVAPQPQVLTYLGDAKQAQSNRDMACSQAHKTKVGLPFPANSCDEYPFASTSEGGANSDVAKVPVWQQTNQAAELKAFYASTFSSIGGKNARFLVFVAPS